MNYIITKNKKFFERIGKYNYCNLEDMKLTGIIAVDTETTALNPRHGDIFSIQIGTGKDNYLIDCQVHNNGYKVEDVIPYLEDRKLVGHNFTFDLTFFYKHGFYPKCGNVHDTMVMSMILHNGKEPRFQYRHGFGYVMERELGVIYDKSEQENIHNTQLRTKKAIQYCFNDVDRLVELSFNMWDKLLKEGSAAAYKVNADYTRALAYMENCGMPLDEDRWQEKMANDLVEFAEKEQKVVEYIFDNLPQFRDLQIDMFSSDKKILPLLTSNKQMIPVFKAFGVDILDDEGKESIDKTVINKSKHEFVKLWLGYKEIEHSVQNQGDNILSKVENGRLYTSYNIMLDTARISTRNGMINFLNFPANEKTRRCFKAKEGFKMVGADFSGQENCTTASFTEDATMLASVNEGLDLHCAFARMIYPEIADLSDEEIKKNHKDKRQASKAPRFLFSFGGSAYGLHKNENIPLKEANEIESKFKELHKGIYDTAEKNYQKAIEKGYIESGIGFKLYLPYFEEFQRDKETIDNFSQDFWVHYKEGKAEHKKKLNKEDYPNYEIQNKASYSLYRNYASFISNFAKKKSRYMRLCMNSPSQSIAAFQTKAATIRLFDTIVKNGHVGDVLICTAVHDELLVEAREDLAEQYRVIVETCMKEEADKFINTKLLRMSADAQVGDSWWDVH